MAAIKIGLRSVTGLKEGCSEPHTSYGGWSEAWATKERAPGMWSFGKPYNHSAVEARLAHRPRFDGKEGAESLPAEEFSLWMCGFAAGVSRMSYHFSACLAPTSPRQDVLSMGMNAVRRVLTPASRLPPGACRLTCYSFIQCAPCCLLSAQQTVLNR